MYVLKKITKTNKRKLYFKRALSIIVSMTILLIPFEWMSFVPEKKYSVIKEVEAAGVQVGVIIIWPGDHSAIPSGYSRVTDLDTYFVEGTTSDPSATPGGAADHAHSSPTHQHDMGHGHTSNSTGVNDGTPVTTGSTVKDAISDGHTHTTTYASNSGNNNTASASLGTTSNNPPYTEVIFITPTATEQQIPDGAWIFWESDTFPTGSWSRQAGNTFMKGAAALGNGGGTGGSSDAHTHTDTGHTHTEPAHTHTATINSTATGTEVNSDTKSSTVDVLVHSHTASGGSTTATEQSDSTANVANGDAQPPFQKMNIIQNDNGATADTPVNTVAMWTGLISNIPSDWQLCDGTPTGCRNTNNVFIKGANADNESGDPTDDGGALSHSHAAGNTHTHTIDSHTHTYTVGNSAASGYGDKLTGSNAAPEQHSHSLSVTESGGSTGTATITADTSVTETRPQYKEVAFIIHKPTTLTQNDWQLYVDNDGLNPADVWGNPDLGENEALNVVPPSNDPIDPADEIRIRITINVTNAALGASSEGFILQYAESNDCTGVSSWTDVDVQAGGGTWRYAASSVTDNTTLTSFLIGVSDVYGRYNKSDPTSTNPNSVSVNQDVEWDFHLEYNGNAEAHSYCFRIIKDDSNAFEGYENDGYPKIDTRPDTSDLMRHGNVFSTLVEKGFFWAD